MLVFWGNLHFNFDVFWQSVGLQQYLEASLNRSYSLLDLDRLVWVVFLYIFWTLWRLFDLILSNSMMHLFLEGMLVHEWCWNSDWCSFLSSLLILRPELFNISGGWYGFYGIYFFCLGDMASWEGKHLW